MHPFLKMESIITGTSIPLSIVAFLFCLHKQSFKSEKGKLKGISPGHSFALC